MKGARPLGEVTSWIWAIRRFALLGSEADGDEFPRVLKLEARREDPLRDPRHVGRSPWNDDMVRLRKLLLKDLEQVAVAIDEKIFENAIQHFRRW